MLTCAAFALVSFSHFNCRKISADTIVLEADYSVQCYGDAAWWITATFSIIFMLSISFGVPFGMFFVMHREMKQQLKQARELKKSRVLAYRDFRDKYGYMCGDYKNEAYYAECIDLVRKLLMTGVLVLLAVSFMWICCSLSPSALLLLANIDATGLLSSLGLCFRHFALFSWLRTFSECKLNCGRTLILVQTCSKSSPICRFSS